MNTYRVLGRGKDQQDYSVNKTNVSNSTIRCPFVSKRIIEINIEEKNVDRLVETVLKVNQTGNKGDGKIFITPLDDVIRIRTNETGIEALA